MRKKILLLILFLLSSLIYSQTLYILIKGDGSTITGYIIEDNPQESVVMEDLEGELHVIIYSNVISISPVIRGERKKEEIPEEKEPIKVVPEVTEVEIIPEVVELPEEEIVITELEIEPIIPLIDTELIKREMTDLSLLELTRLSMDETFLKNSSRSKRYEIYDTLKKDDALTYSLWNIIPGVGSILQGDYSAAIYTLSSVLTTVAYNLIDTGTGNDFYFIINLNGALAYVSSFLAPYRYNNKYNNTLKDKLTL